MRSPENPFERLRKTTETKPEPNPESKPEPQIPTKSSFDLLSAEKKQARPKEKRRRQFSSQSSSRSSSQSSNIIAEVRDKEAKDAGLIVLVSGEVYERQLEHQKRPKEIRDYHLYIEWIDGRYVCYWRAYSNGNVIKEKVLSTGSWKTAIKRAKETIDWWDNKRKT